MTDKTARYFSLSAFACSLAALGMVAYESPRGSSDLEHRDRIEELEREISYLRSGAYPAHDLQEGSERAGDDHHPMYLEDTDEGFGRATRERHDVDEMRWTMTVRGMMPATPAHIERCEKTIFDKGQDIKQKLVALRILNRADRLSDDIVREIITVFHSTDDHRIQEDILEEVDGMTTPELAPTLLKASAESTSYRVRRQALDAMSGFLPDSDLEDWIRYVIKNDGDKRVREEAVRLLDKFGQKVSE